MTRSKISEDGRKALLYLAGWRGLDRAEKRRIPSTDDNDVSGDNRNPEARDSRNPKKRKRGLIDNSSENEPENTVLCEKMDDDEFTRFRNGALKTGDSPKTTSRPFNYDWLRKLLPSAPKGKDISMDTRIVIHLDDDDEDDNVAILRQDHNMRKTISSANKSFSPQNTHHVPLQGYKAETNNDVDSEKSITKEKTNESLGAESDDDEDDNSSGSSVDWKKYNSGNEETDAEYARKEISNRGSISSRTRLRTGDLNFATRVNRASSVGLSNDLGSKSSDDKHRPHKKCQNKNSPPPKKMKIQLSDASSKVDRRGKASQLPQANKDKLIIDPLSNNVERSASVCCGSKSEEFLKEMSGGKVNANVVAGGNEVERRASLCVDSVSEALLKETPKGMVHHHHRKSKEPPIEKARDGISKNKENAISLSKSKNGPDNGGVRTPRHHFRRPEDESCEGTGKNAKMAILPSKSRNGPDNGGVRTSRHHSRRPEDESCEGTGKNTKTTILPSKSRNGPDNGGVQTVHHRRRLEDESGEGTTKSKEKTVPPPSESKNKPDHSGDNNTPRDSDAIASDSHSPDENVRIEEGTAKVEETKQGSKGQFDLCKMLVDCVLGRGKAPGIEEAIDEALNEEPNSQPENHQSATAAAAGVLLPVKFRFDDEVQKEAEKTDREIEEEGWFSELDRVWALSELKALDYAEAEVNENAPITETQHDRCLRGHHELTLRDEEGLVCMCCNHVELGPKEVMPEWAAKTYRGSDRKRRYSAEDIPELDGVDLQPSANNAADFDYYNTEGTVWEIKAGVRETMYEHQREGFEFLWKNIAGSINLDELRSDDEPKNVGGCIISHAPGTGKTRLTIVFVETYMRIFPESRPMIVAPAGMLLTWEEEFRKWNVEFPFFNLNSTDTSNVDRAITSKLLKQRGSTENVRMVKLYSWSTRRSVLGISYSLFEKLTWQKPGKKKAADLVEDERFESMRRILFEKPGLVVLDEGHTPRNQRSNIWNVLLELKTEKRVILSGTPFQNNFCELFNTLRIVRPTMAGSLAQDRAFSGVIASRGKKRGDRSVQHVELDDRAVERLKLSMSPFVHVHKGTILRKNLPGLRDCVVLLKPSDLQRSLIERLEGSLSTFEFEHRVALISVHPCLYQHSDYTEEQKAGVDVRSVEASRLNPNKGAKTRFIMELVHLSNAVDEKVLIFSQYIHPLELIKEQLKEVFKWSEGRQILQLQGSLEQKQRQVLINEFNDPKSDSKVMLASTKCCSEGISLVGASRVVLLDVLWNPSVERQAICRAYRIGQKKVVYTYHLMTLGTTEADKYCRQAEKERLSELVFTSSSNEGNNEKPSSSAAACIEDSFLEQMVGHPRLKGMFEKIINQPKDVNLIETFGATS